jgi:N-acetyl-anhydromuramyl-L-alanine amidase AmpD
MRSLARLVAYLMYTYRIPPKSVVGHSDCKPTDCPGHHMHVAEVRRMATQMLAESEWAYPGSAALARGASAGKRTSH